ncbi:hypothetical protein H0R94_13010 [Treponema socranskii]|uniref:hypothetical protein n=1 Tax=Treponema socranskii TaxID=53419 RepID=UPI003D8EE769
MKNIYKKFLYHITENLPVYIIIFLMFIALCSHLNVQFYDLKNIIRHIVKSASFIAFIGTTIYLFYDIIHTVEGENGIIKQNKKVIQKLENKKNIVLNAISNSAKNRPKGNTFEIAMEAINKSYRTDEERKLITELYEINNKQAILKNQNFDSWKWKIGTLITLNAAFLAVAKFF